MRRIILIAAALSMVGFGQGPMTKSFEAASIKPTEMTNRGFASRTEGPYVTYQGFSVQTLVALGLGVPDYRVVWPKDAGDWVRSERFDIVAKAPGEARPSPSEVNEMVRSLLIERFGMRTHAGTAELPTYSLMVAEGGPKLKAASAEERPLMQRNSEGWVFAASPLSGLASQGLLGVDRPVFDKTGLTGRYTFVLRSDGASIFTALREQLGLRLEASLDAVETLVIDQVEHPSSN
jgi:uncharacterized protein (TIGR03435 family)